MKTLTICLIVGFVGLTADIRLGTSITSSSTQSQANEIALKKILKEMRSKIKQYLDDKEIMPSYLEELVSAGYLEEIPIDPITGKRDWLLEVGSNPKGGNGRQGIVNIHSSASGKDSSGMAYQDY